MAIPLQNGRHLDLCTVGTPPRDGEVQLDDRLCPMDTRTGGRGGRSPDCSLLLGDGEAAGCSRAGFGTFVLEREER